MKRRELTDSEKLKVLELRADGQSYDDIVAEVHRRRSRVIEVVKWFDQELDWGEAVAYCGNNQKVLALRKDYFDRRIAEEREARVKAEEAAAKLESEKATIIAGLAEQDRILASGDFYIDEDTGEIKQPKPIPQFSQNGRLLV